MQPSPWTRARSTVDPCSDHAGLASIRRAWAQIERGLGPGQALAARGPLHGRDKIMRSIDPVIVRPLWPSGRPTKPGRVSPSALAKAKAVAFDTAVRRRTRSARVSNGRNFTVRRLRLGPPLPSAPHSTTWSPRAAGSRGDGARARFPSVGPAREGAELAYAANWHVYRYGSAKSSGCDATGFRARVSRPRRWKRSGAVAFCVRRWRAWPEADVIIGNPPFLGASY